MAAAAAAFSPTEYRHLFTPSPPFDVQPADILPPEEALQPLRLQLDEAVALTAQGLVDGDRPEDRRQALSCGMNGHIAKPINIETMFETLKELLA